MTVTAPANTWLVSYDDVDNNMSRKRHFTDRIEALNWPGGYNFSIYLTQHDTDYEPETPAPGMKETYQRWADQLREWGTTE